MKALMVDVDGVLVHGRPEDGRHWAVSLETDLGVNADDLQREFFNVYWDELLLGRALLEDCLSPVLEKIAPRVSPDQLIEYWFTHDSGIDHGLLGELAIVRTGGIPVYLATNQEHKRAEYLMASLGLACHVDGIFYSAQLGARKPDHNFFDKVASASQFSAEQLFLIDDSSSNIRAAVQAGWNAAHWKRNKRLLDFASAWLCRDRRHQPRSISSNP